MKPNTHRNGSPRLVSLTRIIILVFFPSAFLSGGDWNHWRGPDRSGISDENSGWEKGAWPLQNPAWQKTVGDGASSPLISRGSLYVIGWEKGKDVVRCLDPKSGKTVWEQSYPSPKFGRHATGDQGMYRGATATPELDPETGFLYTLSCDGALHAWDTGNKGKPVWTLSLYDQFKVPIRPQITSKKNTLRDYGYTSSPLVYKDWVIAEVGDPKKGSIKAFDKRTGKLQWESENRDPAGHTGGLVLLEVDGIPCAAVATSWNLLVVRLDGGDAGKTVAEYEWKTDFSNTIAGLAVEGQDLLISSRYNQMAMARVNVSLRGGPKLVWKNAYPTGVCTPVIHDGKIYFANKGIHCVDFKTGKLIWEGGKIGDAGSCLLTADDRLFAWGNGGDLLLVDSAKQSPAKCNILSQRTGLFSDMAWPHIAIAEGQIYCKTLSGEIACFSLNQVARPEEPKMPAVTQTGPWPGSDPGMVVAWKRGGGVAGCVGKSRRIRLEPRGNARLGPNGEMDLRDGSFHVKGIAESLLAEAKESGAISIELALRSGDLNQSGPARIISYSRDPYHRNFTIGQEGDSLVLRLRTPSTGENGSDPEVNLGKLSANELVHLVVTYRPGELITYLNGKEVQRTAAIKGDFSNWEEGDQLLLGDEWSGGSRFWKGQVNAFAIFQRVLAKEEVAARHQAVTSPEF